MSKASLERRYKSILISVFDRIKPTRSDVKKIKKISDMVKSKLIAVLPNDVSVKLAGSFAKGTFLRRDVDIDMFIVFPKHYSFNNMMDTFFSSVARAFGSYEKAYAQHPYAQITFDGIKVDLVPAFEYTGGRPVSAVDRSQAHTIFFNEHADDSIRRDVILLKQFMKNLSIYGAEIKVEGFSGYLCELLVIKYGSFLNVIKAASKWRIPTQICILEKCDFSQFDDTHFIVVDPVDPGRNVASPVSIESFIKFILASKSFLEKPSKDFFFISDKLINKARLFQSYLFIAFKSPNVVDDIKYGQLKRMSTNIFNYLRMNDFTVFEPFVSDDGNVSFISYGFVRKDLPSLKVSEGPVPFVWKHVRGFLSQNPSYVWLYKDRLFGVKRRKFTNVFGALDAFFSSHPLPDHYKDVDIYAGIFSKRGLLKAHSVKELGNGMPFDSVLDSLNNHIKELKRKRAVYELIFKGVRH